ncbi:MAG: Gx transporter family protein [Treponema sp.]|jgi:heptaprenyl diphosphate synthase|nr:Gx transporter family protein [Treponema sp.]
METNGQDRPIALLGALCIFFSGLEYVIPKPLPFIRIGLANIPLLLALDIFPLKRFALLVLLKVLGQALITGTLFSYVFFFSLAGTVSSAACMYLFRRTAGPGILSFTGISVLGALASNVSQLVMARLFIFGGETRYLIPPLLLAALISGAGLGLFCEAFAGRSRWYRLQRGLVPGGTSGVQEGLAQASAVLREDTAPLAPPSRAEVFRRKRRRMWEATFRSGDLFAAALVMAPLFLLNDSLPLRGIQFLLFWFFSFLRGKKNRPLVTLLVMAVIVLFNLQSPYGKVLADFGFFRITRGSLSAGLHKALSLEGLIMLSHAALSPALRIPGAFGKLLGSSLAMFEQMSERRHLITRERPIEGIDALLLELSRSAGDARPSSPERSLPGVCLIVLAVLVIAGLTVLSWCF